jgi:hypothetical protein
MENEVVRSTATVCDRAGLLELIDEALMFAPPEQTITIQTLPDGRYSVTETWRDVCPADRQRFAAICNRGGNDN